MLVTKFRPRTSYSPDPVGFAAAAAVGLDNNAKVEEAETASAEPGTEQEPAGTGFATATNLGWVGRNQSHSARSQGLRQMIAEVALGRPVAHDRLL